MYSKVTKLNMFDNTKELQALFTQMTDREIVTFTTHDLIYADNCDCFVIKQSDKLVAFGALSIRLVPTKGYIGVVEDVVVDESHRNQGLGNQMITFLTTEAKRLRLRSLELTSNASREVARHIYTKKGFVQANTDLFRMNL